MTEQTMPASGGSYIRHPDGRLELVEEPTAPAPIGGPEAAPTEASIEVPAVPVAEAKAEVPAKSIKTKITEA